VSEYHFPQQSPTCKAVGTNPHAQTIMAQLKATILVIKPSVALGKEIAVIETAQYGTGSLVIESITDAARNRLMGKVTQNGITYRNFNKEEVLVNFLGMENGYPRYEAAALPQQVEAATPRAATPKASGK